MAGTVRAGGRCVNLRTQFFGAVPATIGFFLSQAREPSTFGSRYTPGHDSNDKGKLMAAEEGVVRRGRRFGRILLTVLVLAVLLVVLWTWFSLSWAYSEGERAGILQKFSSKGWICKTYEGELALYVVGGVAPQIWYFSTRDEALAAQLAKSVGQRIQLHYTEHKGIPTSCFGDTPHFAKSFTALPEK